ncbi:MAG: hypothetical protein PHO14_05860, partial [Kiritimatiellae bacterium]|nr:hypothetical protein [Kiritimatiellia bacterium]
LCLEYRRWAYPAAGLLPPLLLWIALAPENGTREGHRIGLTWLCASILLVGITTETTRLFQARLRGTPQSPYEALALAMRPHYQPGETLLVLDNNYALHLLLPAPAPPPILSLHVAMVSPGERETLRQRLEVFPPTWIASKNPAYSGIRFGRDQPETVAVREQEGALIISGPYPAFLSCSNAWARRLDIGAP